MENAPSGHPKCTSLDAVILAQAEPKRSFDVYIHLPARLVETRQTHYDQVIHLLTAIVHDLAPVYRGIKTSKKGRRNGDPSKQDGDETAVMGRRRNKDILAQLQQPFDVVHCPSLRGDIPMLECEQIVRLSDSGKVNIKAFSQLVRVRYPVIR